MSEKAYTPNELLSALDGLEMPGGCEYCNAVQVVKANAFGRSRIHVINIQHEDHCPILKKMEAYRERHKDG